MLTKSSGLRFLHHDKTNVHAISSVATTMFSNMKVGFTFYSQVHKSLVCSQWENHTTCFSSNMDFNNDNKAIDDKLEDCIVFSMSVLLKYMFLHVHNNIWMYVICIIVLIHTSGLWLVFYFVYGARCIHCCLQYTWITTGFLSPQNNNLMCYARPP